MTRTYAVMRYLLVLTFACSPTPARPARPEEPDPQGLQGAWQLISIETVGPHGEVSYPFYGKHPAGLIIYDPAGWMSVQIISDPKPNVPVADDRGGFQHAPDAEKAVAADGFYAYFGTYTVDAAASTVTHHATESFYPGERGADFVRHYTITGDRLTLTAKVHEMGEDHQRVLTWQRLRTSAQR